MATLRLSNDAPAKVKGRGGSNLPIPIDRVQKRHSQSRHYMSVILLENTLWFGERMSSAKNLFEVEIGGIGLKLRTSYSEDTVKQLVKYVDDRLNESLSATKSGSLQTAAILTALNIAEEHLLLKKRANIELDQIQNKAQRILSQLESSQVPKPGTDL
jgi:cell division protein ZapA